MKRIVTGGWRTWLFAGLISIAPAADPALRVSVPWARATSPQAVAGGAFAILINDGEDDALLGATSAVAETVELHTHLKDERGILRMTEVERIPVPAHQTTTMQPGGFHFMLMGLTRQLRPGTSFPLTCRFARAGSITVDVQVLEAGAMGPATTGTGK